MQSFKKYYFGKQKIEPNTFIGGVSSIINTSALVATKLGVIPSRIKAFSIIGSDIQFAVVGGQYTIPGSCFINDNSITYYNDSTGLITGFTGGQEFRNSNIQSVNFPNVTTFNNSILNFYKCTSLVSVSFPKVTRLWTQAFQLCTSLQLVNFPLLTTVGPYVFANNPLLGSVSIPLCSNLGGSPAYNNVFEGIKIGATISVPLSLQTANSGAPDGDLVYASGTRGAIITYV